MQVLRGSEQSKTSEGVVDGKWERMLKASCSDALGDSVPWGALLLLACHTKPYTLGCYTIPYHAIHIQGCTWRLLHTWGGFLLCASSTHPRTFSVLGCIRFDVQLLSQIKLFHIVYPTMSNDHTKLHQAVTSPYHTVSHKLNHAIPFQMIIMMTMMAMMMTMTMMMLMMMTMMAEQDSIGCRLNVSVGAEW